MERETIKPPTPPVFQEIGRLFEAVESTVIYKVNNEGRPFGKPIRVNAGDVVMLLGPHPRADGGFHNLEDTHVFRFLHDGFVGVMHIHANNLFNLKPA